MDTLRDASNNSSLYSLDCLSLSTIQNKFKYLQFQFDESGDGNTQIDDIYIYIDNILI